MRNDDIPCCELDFWLFLAISFVLVLFSGITSGLALGLLSFTQVDLEVLIKSGQLHDQKNAAKILPLIKNEHLLLCTLLISKSLAMEALPIFLDSILPSWAAIIMSVTLVVAFAEVIPQAVCSRYGLSIGAKMSSFVRLLLFIFFPISKPISKAGKGGELSHHETMIINGALDLTQKIAKDAMTHISETFSLEINSKLDITLLTTRQTMGLIASKGHSRIPVYSGSKTNIIGLILNTLMVYDNWPLYDILNQFQKGHSHMAAVVRSKDIKHDHKDSNVDKHSLMNLNLTPGETQAHSCIFYQKEHLTISNETSPSYSFEDGDVCCGSRQPLQIDSSEEVIGIITMEDVMEELLQEDIFDETDQYVDVHNKIKINLRPLRRSSSRSPKRSISHLHWRTPDQSPLSSDTPISIESYSKPPLIRSSLLYESSPGKSAPNSPVQSEGGSLCNSSPSSYRVCQNSKLGYSPSY
ncbi:hypothetical protein G4B88_019482 [Cannabis sativa]|uniref:CNNM transmembrane domain-containing protein n=1 Tax=Cannabis sativa TaxID=3483 RepID=A0A7J6HYD7_CANSA|nr:hypothetical protein G4B88_019482 [Cannabis sativa]